MFLDELTASVHVRQSKVMNNTLNKHLCPQAQ